MNEEQVRALVREALARHLDAGRDRSPSGPSASPTSSCAPCASSAPVPTVASFRSHLAFGRFISLAPTDPDAPCIVEPQVKCHHCGFCQSYGH